MPTSPIVNFNFQNNNVLETTPQLGISFVYARTTKGPRNDASKVISSYPQFQRIYGEEVVPNGRISQIEKAFQNGSKLRVCRVLADDCKLGFVYSGSKSTTPSSVAATAKNVITLSDGTRSVSLGFNTKSYGEEIDAGDSFGFKLVVQNYAVYAQVYKLSDENKTVLENIYLFSLNGNKTDGAGLTKYNDMSAYLDLAIKGFTGTWDSKPNTLVKLKAWWEGLTGLTPAATLSGTPETAAAQASLFDEEEAGISAQAASDTFAAEQSLVLNGYTGTPGTTPTLKNWTDALPTLLDYVDIYAVAAPSINHFFSQADVLKFHTAAAKMIVPLQEYHYNVELPWWSTPTSPAENADIYDNGIMNDTQLVALVKTWIGTIGNSKYIAYFAGGAKFYNAEGNLENSEALGTILGLADTCASIYGPWRSFAGMNRGIMYDAVGPVVPNYGSPSRYEALNELAQNYLNMTVIKDTPQGKQTLLWHLFTSQFKQDSERFLTTVRLNLYLKKNLRPIAEKYIEEPNVWGTWKDMYLQIKPILDNLITQNAITEYSYLGDQDASSWSDLAVNTEADCRQGKYKVIIKYKDVVPMQEITFNLIIDAASKSVTVTEE